MQPINTALLSFGMSGKVFHAPFLTVHPGFELYGVWERTQSLSREFYPAIKIFRSLEDLLADTTIRLVIVNTPTATHFEYTKRALEAGKDVVVEKAFTTTVAEAETLQQIALTLGRKLSVFQNRRWDSDFKTVQKIIHEGWLGNIVEAEFHFDRFKETLSPKAHKETPGAGAGILKDLGPHLADQAIHLFGMPMAVFADLRITRPGSLIDDYFEVLLYYPELRVRLKAGYQVREPIPAYIIHGSKGSFLKSRGDVQEIDLTEGKVPDKTAWGIEPDTEQGLLHTEKDGILIRKHIATLPGNYYDYYDALYKALTEDTSMPVTAEDGIKTMRVIEAAFKSSVEGKVIYL